MERRKSTTSLEGSMERKPIRCMTMGNPHPRPRGRPPNTDSFSKLDEANKWKDADPAIDKTVSMLVKNIMTESRRKEQETQKEYERRCAMLEARKHWLSEEVYGNKEEQGSSEHSEKKRKIAHAFPTISSQLGRQGLGIVDVKGDAAWEYDGTAMNTDDNSMGQSSEVGSSAGSVIVVKTEPVSDPEYEFALVGAGGNSVGGDNNHPDVSVSSCELDSVSVSSAKETLVDNGLSDSGKRQRPTAVVHIDEDGIDLPFVEDYYQNYSGEDRGSDAEMCGQNVKHCLRRKLGYGVVDNTDGKLLLYGC